MQVTELLRASRKPLFHVGQGVRLAGAADDFMRLMEFLQVPFVTARNANDICASDHALCIGRPGTFAQRGANFAVQNCDLYIAIGTRLSLPQTGYNSKDYARNAKIVHVDIDQTELDKGTLNNPIRICMDARAFILQLKASLDWLGDWKDWLARCQSWRDRYPVVLPEYAKEKGHVNSYHFIETLSELATPEDTIVTDMGFAFQNTHQTWKIKVGQRLLTNCGLAPMGWGLPAAVGAAFATGRRVICITGDGGLMMNIQELATIQHHQLNIKIFLLDNKGYLTIKQTQQLGFDGRLMGVNADSGLSFPDWWYIRAAHKFSIGCQIELLDHENFPQTVANALYGDGPRLIPVRISPEQAQAPRALNRRNADGSMNPTKLEDSYPFLPPEVIAEEMK